MTTTRRTIMKKICASITLMSLLMTAGPITIPQKAEARYLQTTVAPGEFQTARMGFTATLITTGNNKGQILIAGGFDGTNYLDSAERFNPGTGAYTAIPSTRKMVSKRMNHAAVTLPDGKIVLTGGRDSATTLTNTMEIYDPLTDKFTNLFGAAALPNMSLAREFHTSTIFPDPLDPTNSSVILSAGGSDGTAYTNKAEIYTSGTNIVENTTNNMITTRGKQAAYFFPSTATASKGSVLFLGGTNDMTGGLPVPKGANEYYDASLKTFVNASLVLTDPRVEFMHTDYSTTATPQIFISGGRISATSVSATADTITHNGTNFVLTARGSMTSKRKNAVAVSTFENSNTTNKKVYVIGGRDANNADLLDYETYNISTNLFTAVTPNTLIAGRNNFKALVLPLISTNGGNSNNGQIVLIGGSNNRDPIVRTSEFLDTHVSQITSADMLFPRSDFEMKSITDTQVGGSHYSNYGKILVFGGMKTTGMSISTTGVARTEVELYDPLTNKFTDLCTAGRNATSGVCNNPAQEMRVQRVGFSATQMPDGKIYIIGGIAPITFPVGPATAINTVEIFDPQTSTFSVQTPTVTLPNRAYQQATILSNDQILITGGTDWSNAYISTTLSSSHSYNYYRKAGIKQSLIYTISTGTFTDKWNGTNLIGLTVGDHWGHTAMTINGSIYLAGGGSNIIEKYDAGTGQFTSVTNTGPTGHYLKNITSGDTAFLFGGTSSAQDVCFNGCGGYAFQFVSMPVGSLATTSLFSAVTNTTTAGPSFTQSIGGSDAVLLGNGKYLITGSITGSATNGCRVYSGNGALGFLYDPLVTSLTPLVGDLKYAHGASKMVRIVNPSSTINKGKILIAGGLATPGICPDPVGTAELYDPENLAPAVSDDAGGLFVPQNNQTFTTHQPVLSFSTTDPEADDIKYQVQIVDQAIGFPFDDFEPTNAASLVWNFIQVNDPTGFTGQDGLNNIYYKSGSTATLDLSNTPQFLPSGTYSMRIRAIDPTGSHTYSGWGPSNSGSVINFTINAEENAPVSVITSPQAQTYNTLASLASLTGTASDTGTNASGMKKVMVSVKDNTTNMYWNDNNGFTFAGETYFAATGTTGWSYPRTGVIPWVSGKSYTVHTSAVDNVGNIETTGPSVQFTYDTTFVPTTITLTSPTTSENVAIGTNKTVTWTVGGGVVPDHYEISYSKDNFVTSVPISTNVNGSLTSYTWTVPNDASTTTTLRIVAKNAAGQTLGTGTSTGSFTISSNGGDITAPTVTITGPTDGSSVQSVSSIQGTATDNGTISSIKVTFKDKTTGKYFDGTGFTSATEVQLPVTGTSSPWSYTTTGVPFAANTNYDLGAIVTDAGGNITTKTATISYQPTATNTNTNTGNTNTNTGTTNTNTNTTPAATTTTPAATTTQPTIIITGGSSGGGPVYPIYPSSYNSTPTPSTASTSSTTNDSTAPTSTITYPQQNAALTSVSSIQGVSSDNDGGVGVSYVLVSIFDQTSKKYFDGTSFTGQQPSEFKATGAGAWSLALPEIFTLGHSYTVAAKALDKSGNNQNIPAQVSFTFGAKQAEPATTASVSTQPIPASTPETSTPATDNSNAQMASMLQALERIASKPAAPVQVQVTAPKTAAPVTTSDNSTHASAPKVAETLTNANTNTSSMTPSSDLGYPTDLASYNNAYDTYKAAHPEIVQNPLGFDTVGLRDTDSDGLSDAEELKLKTNPFGRDTDQDGFTDGEEVLEYGTNPLDPASKPGTLGVRITNLDNGTTTNDTKPMIVGFAKPGSDVTLYDVKPNGDREVIGTAKADDRGRFIVTPNKDLSAGEHSFVASLKGSNGEDVDLSPIKKMTIDPSLNIPAPQVEDIKTPGKKPQVYGKTQYGTTVVANFQSLVTTSSIIADTTSGDFIVSSAMPLEDGDHKVTLYAILPNGVRSPSVTVPFKVSNNPSSTSALKADVTGAGNNVWWLIGSLLPLLLLVLLLLWYLTHKKDTLLFSIDKKELSKMELSKVGDAFTFISQLPVQQKDFACEYIAFYFNSTSQDHIGLQYFKDVKEGNVILFGKVLDTKYFDTYADNMEVQLEDLNQKQLERYKASYVFEQFSIDMKQFEEFYGKKHIASKKLIDEPHLITTDTESKAAA